MWCVFDWSDSRNEHQIDCDDCKKKKKEKLNKPPNPHEWKKWKKSIDKILNTFGKRRIN